MHRVLHLIPRLAVSPEGVAIGGSAVSLLSLIRAQAASADLKVGLIAGVSASDAPLQSVLERDIDVYPIPVHATPVTYRFGIEFLVKTRRALPRIRSEFNPTLVHGHSGRWHYALGFSYLSRKLGCPWIHSLYCPVAFPRVGGTALSLLLRNTLRDAAVVTGMSRNVVRSIDAVKSPVRRLAHVDPCLDLVRYSGVGDPAATREQLDIPENATLLLFVGNTHKSKGFDVLWKAFQKVRQNHANAYLVATFELGGASDRTINVYSDAAVDRFCRFLGVVDNMPDLLRAADIVVVPFRSTDGPSDYPLVMLEAMAAGTAVVASNVGGVSEVLSDVDSQLLVPPGDSNILADRLGDLLTDGARRDWVVSRASSVISARFAPERAVDCWRELYAGV